MSRELQLRDNDRVAIIGAGPAGSLFAYLLLRLGQRENLRLQVDLYDPRDFRNCGPPGCNKCAGVIGPNLWERLERIGIHLEGEKGIIQSVLRGYLWNTESGGMRVEFPEGFKAIRTVFRGGGPYAGMGGGNISFDQHLLNQALSFGARRYQERVVSVELPAEKSGPVRLNLWENNRPRQIEAELVVGAFGLNSHLVGHFTQIGIGYCPPRWVRAAQLELRRSAKAARRASDEYITVYNFYGRRVRQLVLTPKGNYATLTMLGRGDLQTEDLQEVKHSRQMSDLLQGGWEWPEKPCLCFPRLELRNARNFFGDRLVLIGDAACCRYYKNGIESALSSAEAAADCVVYHGVSRWSFHRWYYPRVWREIIHDNFFGRLLLSINQSISIRPSLMRLFMQARASMVRERMVRQHDYVIWDILTGNRPYRHIFYRLIQPDLFLMMNLHLGRVLWKKLSNILRRGWRRIRPWGRQRESSYSVLSRAAGSLREVFYGGIESSTGPDERREGEKSARPRKALVLGSGSRVSIIGGGPAGAGCAITLMRLARQQNIDLEVTIHEPKDFRSATVHKGEYIAYDDKRFNQCIGVLSPPIFDIVTRQLGIRFPDELVQKHILGYVLHGRRQMITLDELYGSSYALRRITFDAYMMQQAVKQGVRLNQAEVVDIEKKGRHYTLVTTGGTAYADVVVGAFGVDQGAADIFERVFGYRRPEYMQTIVTKKHPAEGFLRNFGLRIHVFLPPMAAVEFGAITPKFNHLTVNIAGRQVDEGTMLEFISLPQVAALLPNEYEEKGNERYYPGCFPTGPAQNFIADRMVMVGDSSGMLRPFKGKGVNAAIISGMAAGCVMVHRGVGGMEFQRYYLPTFRQITEDIWYARTARWLTNMLSNTGGMDLVLNIAQQSPTLQRALTEAVAGACTYKTILHRLTTERILWRAGADLLRKILKKKSSLAGRRRGGG